MSGSECRRLSNSGTSSAAAAATSEHHLRQLALRIALRDLGQRLRRDLARLALAAELHIALAAYPLRRLARRLQEVARIELLGVLAQVPAHGGRHRQADVGVDVDQIGR